MTLSYADLFVKSGDAMNADFFNRRFQLIINEIAAAEALASTYGSVSSQLLTLGLASVNASLTPLIAELQQAASLGFLVAPSTTSATLTASVQSNFTIAPAYAAVFQPTSFLTVQDAGNSAHWATGQLAGWNAATGALGIGITYTSTGGTISGSNWVIAAGSATLPAAIAAQVASAASASAATTQAGIATTQAGNAATSATTAATDLAAIQAALTSGPVLSVAGLSGTISAAALIAALALTANNVSGVMHTSGGALTGSLGFAPIASVAASSTVNLGALLSNVVSITGTTAISSFGSSVASGYTYLLAFVGSLTLTNSAALVLPGGQNIITAPGDTCFAVCLGSGNWMVAAYQRADGGGVSLGLGRANTWTGTQTLSGSTSVPAAVIANIAEPATISATAATGTINFYLASQSVLYYTSNASANWTMNFAWSPGTSLNSALAIGQAVTVAFLVTQGSTAYYANSFKVDTVSVTPKWQGGVAPIAGHPSGIDLYAFTLIKTGAGAWTILASQTQFA